MRELDHGAQPTPTTSGVGLAALEAFLDDIREMPAAPLYALFARQVAALGVEPVVGSLGVQFRHGETTLCELSPYEELFIARVGPGLAVEYRVRSAAIAFQALDHVLRAFVACGAAPAAASPS
jgi:hypothetical protein